MSFCSFSTEYNKSGVIALSSSFVTDYLSEATGDAVRVYLYGLYACNSKVDYTIENMAEELNISCDEVIDSFRYWEEYDLVSIISEEPFEVRYLPLSGHGKPRKFKPEKYSEFTSALQALLPDRMISTSEYTAYFNIMEEFAIKPEAMLMICKYCVDLKGAQVGYKYITTVAKDFAYRGIITTELIERELSDYISRSDDISAVLSALSLKRKPEIEDLQLFKKWRGELGYEQRVIIFIAKKCKKKNFSSLDNFIAELYANKLFEEKEIENYLKSKEEYRNLATKICKELSVYVEVIDTVIENYLSPWLAKGYDGDTLVFLAGYCFRRNRRSLQDLDSQINNLYDNGLITLSSIAEYMKGLEKQDEFIRRILLNCGIDRRPTSSDRNFIKTWFNWGFSENMITEACLLSAGAVRPLVYVNAILSDWKSKGIFTKDKIPSSETAATTVKSSNIKDKTKHFANEHNYTKEELDALIDNVEDLEF